MDAAITVIQRGLPEHLREAGVILFDDAFGDKLRIAIPDPEQRLAFMTRVLCGEHAVVARRGDELLGMLGLSSGSGRYRGGLLDVPWDPRPYRHLLGLRDSLRAVLGLRLAEHHPAVDELYVDGVAVAPAARGEGIGTRLLHEAVTVAREDGLRWLRLHVVDTNPRAQALYERLGFRVTGVEKTRPLDRWLGYDAIISMEMPVEMAGGRRD